jgi:tubulin polyglutamylase TTLL6/13
MPLNGGYDLTWHDTAITVDFFSRLNPWQKVNMYPGIQCITKKHTLAKNLMRMYKHFPQEYNFFPKTFILPSQFMDLRNHFAHNQSKKITYIVKPDSMCQGKGIFLSRNIEDILEKTKNNELLEDFNLNEEKIGYVV